jgi:predicted small secreted protein
MCRAFLLENTMMKNHENTVRGARGDVRVGANELSRDDRREIRGLFGRGVRGMAYDARALRRVEVNPAAMQPVLTGGAR